jgi:hypothetical protein
MDTTQAAVAAGAGIPEAGMRTIYLVAVLFVLCITALVIVGRMKEVDEER